MGRIMGCVMRAGSLTAVPAMPVGLLTGHPTARPAVHHSVSRMKRSFNGYGSWCTTGRLGGTLQLRRTASVVRTLMEEVLRKTMSRQSSGSESRESRPRQGNALAQYNLGAAYLNGKGDEQDVVKGVKWLQLAAEQGHKDALKGLDLMQQHNVIPIPPPSTAVTTILLTSANATNYNNKVGKVVEPAEGAAIKPGRAAVLLDGEAAPISFKLMNVRVDL